jgi:predicted transcriptional regulator
MENEQWKIHPIHDVYEVSNMGRYRYINNRNNVHNGTANKKYLYASVKNKKDERKTITMHKLVWTCFNGEIPSGFEIDHINDNGTDNRLINLQLLSRKENNKKAQKNRDMKKITGKDAYNSRKDIMLINLGTNEKLVFRSKYQCAQYLNVSPALVYYFVNKKDNNILVSNDISYKVTHNIDEDADKVPLKKVKKINNETKEYINNYYEVNKEKCRDLQKKYIEKMGKVKCDTCNVEIRYYYKKRHDETKTHIYNKYILNKN